MYTEIYISFKYFVYTQVARGYTLLYDPIESKAVFVAKMSLIFRQSLLNVYGK